MNHVIAFFVSAFIGMQLIVTAILFPGTQETSAFIILTTAASVGLIGAAFRELEIGMLRFQEERSAGRL
ncbi:MULTISPECIES: hypothetical protein [unclassified Pannonibacter]|uniref:hypothetical protein n=1 Tax=unclassified Pannonibacter TaxID=2627228 RepID=UPI00164666A2|nr:MULTISPECIES: hypothetical protein [unclassified Pannonibacter]